MKLLILISWVFAGRNLPIDHYKGLPAGRESPQSQAIRILDQIRTAMTPTLKKEELIAVVDELNETKFLTADSLIQLVQIAGNINDVSTIPTIPVNTNDAVGVMNQIRNAISPSLNPKVLIGTIKGIENSYPLDLKSIERLIKNAARRR